MFTVGFHDLLYHYLDPLICTLPKFVVLDWMTALIRARTMCSGTKSRMAADSSIYKLLSGNSLVFLRFLDSWFTIPFEFSRFSVSVSRTTFFTRSSFPSESAFFPAWLEFSSFSWSTFAVFITALLTLEFLIFTVEDLVFAELTLQGTIE